jgi:hypothetical protein
MLFRIQLQHGDARTVVAETAGPSLLVAGGEPAIPSNRKIRLPGYLTDAERTHGIHPNPCPSAREQELRSAHMGGTKEILNREIDSQRVSGFRTNRRRASFYRHTGSCDGRIQLGGPRSDLGLEQPPQQHRENRNERHSGNPQDRRCDRHDLSTRFSTTLIPTELMIAIRDDSMILALDSRNTFPMSNILASIRIRPKVAPIFAM